MELHPADRPERIGARPEMGDLAKIFKRVAFLLKRIGRVGLADQIEGLDRQFVFLALALRRHQFPFDPHRRPGEQLFQHRVFVWIGHNRLKIPHAGAVVDLDKSHGLGYPDRLDPAKNSNSRIRRDGVIDQYAGNFGSNFVVHCVNPSKEASYRIDEDTIRDTPRQ